MVKTAGKSSKSKSSSKKKITKKHRTSTMAATISDKNKGMKRKPRATLTRTMKETIAEG